MKIGTLERILQKGFEVVEDAPISCPMCKGDNNHLHEVRILSGDDDYAAEGVMTLRSIQHFTMSDEPLRTPNRIQNLGIVITFECELCALEGCGLWHRVFSYHKGSTWVGDVTRSAAGCPPDCHKKMEEEE